MGEWPGTARDADLRSAGRPDLASGESAHRTSANDHDPTRAGVSLPRYRGPTSPPGVDVVHCRELHDSSFTFPARLPTRGCGRMTYSASSLGHAHRCVSASVRPGEKPSSRAPLRRAHAPPNMGGGSHSAGEGAAPGEGERTGVRGIHGWRRVEIVGEMHVNAQEFRRPTQAGGRTRDGREGRRLREGGRPGDRAR